MTAGWLFQVTPNPKELVLLFLIHALNAHECTLVGDSEIESHRIYKPLNKGLSIPWCSPTVSAGPSPQRGMSSAVLTPDWGWGSFM